MYHCLAMVVTGRLTRQCYAFVVSTGRGGIDGIGTCNVPSGTWMSSGRKPFVKTPRDKVESL